MSTTAAPEQSARPTSPAIARAVAALIGFLAVGAALGVGHLVAAPISPSSSPFLAVGDTVIRYSPPFLTEFAKTAFGTADKPVLLGGMAVVIGLIAAAAGIVSRGTPRVGVMVITVLGILGLLAVVDAPGFTRLDLLAPVVALVVGVGSFQLLHWAALRAGQDVPVRAGKQTAEPNASWAAPAGGEVSRRDVSRRNVLIGSSVAVGAGAVGAGLGGQLLATNIGDSRTQVTRQVTAARITPAPPIPPGADFAEFGTPTFITPNPAFYRVDAALLIPSQAASDWSMRIHGMVDREITLTFDDLLRRPLVERTITLTCVSNEVGGRYISTANFIGVDLRDLLLEAGVQPGADQVLSTGADGGWTAGTPTDVLLEPDRDSMLAIGMNGEALPPEHGFPVRMVVPGLYGFLSATKWLTDIEVTTFDAAQGYWLQRGWGQKAPIKTQSRIDSPRPFATVPAGRVTVAGIAWSQPVGIERVDVRADGGAWRVAELSTEVNYDTWRMWTAELDLGPGSHTVQVRATDRNGITQPEARVEPIPDGATGWHSTLFTVG